MTDRLEKVSKLRLWPKRGRSHIYFDKGDRIWKMSTPVVVEASNDMDAWRFICKKNRHIFYVYLGSERHAP